MPVIFEAQKQHPVLPLVMVLAGAAPLLNNGYPESVQVAGFILAGTGGLLAWFCGRRQGFNPGNCNPGSCGPFWPGLLFLTWLALGLAWSVEVNATVNETLRTALYLAFFWQVRATFSREEVDKLLTVVILVGTLVAMVGLLQYLFIKADRIQATFINPNPLGIYLAMVVLLGLGRYWQQGGRLLAVGLVISGTALVFSYSRGSLLALGGGLLASFWLSGREGRIERLRALAGLCLMTLLLVRVIALLAPWTQGLAGAESILRALIRPDTFMESSVEGRLAFWRAAVGMFLARPWTGFGGGSFHDVYFSFYDGGRWYSRYVHNHYLQVLAETGWPGLLIFLGMVAALLLPFWRQRQRGPLAPLQAASGGAVMAFLLHIGLDFSWDMPAVTLTFWTAAACGLFLLGEGALNKEQQAALPQNLPAGGGLASGMGSRNTFTYRLNLQGLMTFFPLVLSLLILTGGLLLGGGYLYACQGDRAAAANRREAALAGWRRAVMLNPWNDTYHARLGAALATAPKGTPAFREGGRELQRALELSPYDYNHASQLAFYEQRAGNQAEAGRLFQQAVAVGGYVPSLYFDLGNFYVVAGQKDLAGEIWNKGLIQAGYALEMAPAPFYREQVLQVIRALRINLARYYEEKGWYGFAADQLRQVLALFPGDPLAGGILAGYRAAGHLDGS
ncbi:O-antigen ligase family protein [Moorella naiadis]|uniref:O-antigen ligase family protein n=1 Tax=Moorella naiadis (nom. illeg.) TaxID=3093670 RepID=UPI003D9C8E85